MSLQQCSSQILGVCNTSRARTFPQYSSQITLHQTFHSAVLISGRVKSSALAMCVCLAILLKLELFHNTQPSQLTCGIKSKGIGRGKLVRLCIFACFHGISLKRSRFRKIIIQVRVVLKTLMGRLEPCSARIDRQTERDTHTHTQTKYCNPSCACTPRVIMHFCHCLMLQNTVDPQTGVHKTELCQGSKRGKSS